jgi:hypothetical protein
MVFMEFAMASCELLPLPLELFVVCGVSLRFIICVSHDRTGIAIAATPTRMDPPFNMDEMYVIGWSAIFNTPKVCLLEISDAVFVRISENPENSLIDARDFHWEGLNAYKKSITEDSFATPFSRTSDTLDILLSVIKVCNNSV